MQCGYVTIKYCHTNEMARDFFGKPLGGAKFCQLGNIMIYCSHVEYGSVNVTSLMAAYHRTTENGDVTHKQQNEPKLIKDNNPKLMGSQECV